MEESSEPTEGINTCAFIVICAGSLAGSTVQGLTGFGKAILLVLVWVLAKLFVDAGPLATAVITDSITSMVLAVPYFILTKAMKTADVRLVTTLYLSRNVSAPLGALALVVLNKCITELAMALVLLALVLMSVDCSALLTRIKRKQPFATPQKDAARLADIAHSSSRDHLYLPLNPSLRSISSCRSEQHSELSFSSADHLHADTPSCASPTATSVSTPLDLNCCLRSGAQHEQQQADNKATVIAAHVEEQQQLLDSSLLQLQSYPVSPYASAFVVGKIHMGQDDMDEQAHVSEADSTHHAELDNATDSSLQHAPLLSVAGHQRSKSAGPSGRTGCSAAGINRSDGGLHGHRLPLSRLSLCTRGVAAVWDAHPQLSDTNTHTLDLKVSSSLLDMQPSHNVNTSLLDMQSTHKADISHFDVQPTQESQQQRQQQQQPVQEQQQQTPSPNERAGAEGDQNESHDDSTVRLLAADAEAGSSSSGFELDGGSRARRMYVRAKQSLRDKANQRILVLGSLCGAAAGLLEGLLGVGGPPIMYLYAKLNTPQDVARGTNGMMGLLGLLSLRIVAYWMLGVYQKADIPLYCTASVLSLGGMGAGLYACKYVNQKGFKNCLLLLMSICCALMFLSAAGLAG